MPRQSSSPTLPAPLPANDRFGGACSWRQAKPVLLHPRFYQGFRDALAGRPFDYAYVDALPEPAQHLYENGREVAAECLQAGLRPRWSSRDRIPRALKDLVVGRALRRARDEPRTDPHRPLRGNA